MHVWEDNWMLEREVIEETVKSHGLNLDRIVPKLGATGKCDEGST
jgi:hypothetical protein